jgi:aminoglycoside phosphotransferase (APT) family kinase protein
MKMYCWKKNDDFGGIIRGYCRNVLRISEIKSGWTNFVFLAETDTDGERGFGGGAARGGFIFRFPRTKFFEQAMLAEYAATKYIGRFISAAEQELRFHAGRPFTVHRYIEGEPLSSAFGRMTEEQKQIIADGISEYLTKLQSIKYSHGQFGRLSGFLVRLAAATKNEKYDYDTFIELVKRENSGGLVLCHGDLNPDNILVKDNRLVCVIDYAFAGISAPDADISRICNRMPAIAKYFTPNPKLVAMWDYVDNNYVEYMKIYHKEVVV